MPKEISRKSGGIPVSGEARGGRISAVISLRCANSAPGSPLFSVELPQSLPAGFAQVGNSLRDNNENDLKEMLCRLMKRNGFYPEKAFTASFIKNKSGKVTGRGLFAAWRIPPEKNEA